MVADSLSLTNEERNRRVPSGNRVFENDCIQPMKELVDAGLLERPNHGIYKITHEGGGFLQQNPEPPEEPDTIDEVSPPPRPPETIDDFVQRQRSV